MSIGYHLCRLRSQFVTSNIRLYLIKFMTITFCDIHFGLVTICNPFIFVLMFYVICHFTFFVVYKVVDAILLFVGKDTTFPRNFQGFGGKCREEDKEKNRRLSQIESRLLNILCLYDETDAYFLINSHLA